MRDEVDEMKWLQHSRRVETNSDGNKHIAHSRQ